VTHPRTSFLDGLVYALREEEICLRSTTTLLIALVLVLLVDSPFRSPAEVVAAPVAWRDLGPFGGAISALVVDPTQPATVYAAAFNGGIFKTTNGGTSWSAAADGLLGTGLG
jgi:hypothetical protein